MPSDSPKYKKVHRNTSIISTSLGQIFWERKSDYHLFFTGVSLKTILTLFKIMKRPFLEAEGSQKDFGLGHTGLFLLSSCLFLLFVISLNAIDRAVMSGSVWLNFVYLACSYMLSMGDGKTIRIISEIH